MPGQPTQETAISKERITYISSGIAFILFLVLCFILGFLCYRRSQHRQIKRLFTVVVNNTHNTLLLLILQYDETWLIYWLLRKKRDNNRRDSVWCVRRDEYGARNPENFHLLLAPRPSSIFDYRFSQCTPTN